jgi:hypothetical protein
MPPGAKLVAVEIMKISTKISHNPRVSRNRPRSAGLLRATMSPALVPDRNTNTGAQKCVIHRVNASGSPTFGSFMGSIDIAVLKKSRV